MRYLIFSFFFIFSSNALFSQEQIGSRLDNYSGINGVMINPTQSITSPFSWDLNLASLGFNAQSNYGFFKNSNVLLANQNRDNFVLQRDIENAGVIANERSLIGVANNNNSKKYFSTFGFATGPSLMVNLESGHSFGIFTNARFGVSIQNIPEELSFDRFYDTPYFDFLDVSSMHMAGMSWGELGLNYAYKMPTYDGYMGFGINVKFLRGYEAFYAQTNDINPTAQVPGDTLLFQALTLDYGLTTSNLSTGSGDDFTDISPNVNGSGVGIDLGYTYIYEGDEDNYKWKIGASILDLGSIRFDKNAEAHDLRNDTLQIFPQERYKDGNVNQRIKLLSYDTYADSSASLVGRNFKIALPTAISVQADFMLIPNVYVNGLLVQRLAFENTPSLRRNNLIAITPRFEHRWYGGGMSFSLLNYKQMAVGLSARLAFLTIGSEDIGSFFGKRKLNSTDFYIGLKINPFDIGLNFGGGGGGRGKDVKCYQF